MKEDLSVEVLGGRLVIREPRNIREIPLEAIASYGELLGYADPMEALEAIIHIQDHGEPDPCPETGENVWTDAYTLLSHREEEREKEAVNAKREGTADDPRSPKLRSALAAYNAVHVPIGGGECVMDRCRREARGRLGIPDATVKPGAGSRMAPARLVSRMVSVKPLRETLLEDAVQSRLDEVTRARTNFLHGLTSMPDNPLEEEEAPGPADTEDPLQTVMDKYGGGRD